MHAVMDRRQRIAQLMGEHRNELLLPAGGLGRLGLAFARRVFGALARGGHAPLDLAQRLLRHFAGVDIDVDDDPFADRAFIVEKGRSMGAGPSPSVALLQAKLRLINHAGRDGLPPFFFGFVPIIGMDRIQPGEPLAFSIRMPGKFAPGRMILGRQAFRVGFPDRLRRASDERPKPLFAVAQRLLRRPALLNVHQRADIAVEMAIFLDMRRGDGEHPAIDAVEAAQATFEAIGLAALKGLRPNGLN